MIDKIQSLNLEHRFVTGLMKFIYAWKIDEIFVLYIFCEVEVVVTLIVTCWM